MTKNSNLFDLYGQFINPTYPLFLKRLGLDKTAAKAEGACITDAAGKTYIDCIGGYGLFNLGHNHPKVIKALTDQLNERQLFTRPFITDLQVELATCLAEITPGDLTFSFVCNSGSEAIDNALKLARLYQGRKKIISAQNSFHGFTFGALSATGIPSFKRPFEPLVPDFYHVPFGDSEALSNATSADTAAVLLEPVQHEAGVCLPPDNYLREVRQICDEKGIILIIDEIKTGFGKTGKMFACDHFKIVPDILVLGKSMGGGLMPIGAIIGKKSLWRKFGQSFIMSASSFAGNVLACRAALTAIEIFTHDGILDACLEKGERLMSGLKRISARFPKTVKGISGLGLLMGIDTTGPRKAHELSRGMIQDGVLSVQAFANPAFLMIEPPLVLSLDQVNQILSAFESACEKLDQNDQEM